MGLDPVRRIARATIPPAIRKRLADAVYRTADRLRALGLGRPPGTLGGASRAVRYRLGRAAGLPARAVVARGRRWFEVNMTLLWARAPLTAAERRRAAVLRRVLRYADRHFERRFRHLLTAAAPVQPTGRPRPLVVAAIGTLGPGGAERQLVNTLVGLKRAFDVDIEVLVMYQDQEWQRFFRHALERAGIAVTVVPREIDRSTLTAELHPRAPALAAALDGRVASSLGHVASYVRVLLERRPDVVHLWLDEVNVKGGLAAVLAGVPRIVLSMRSVNPTHFVFYQPYMRAGYVTLLERGQVYPLNNSQHGAGDYERWLGLSPGRVRVVRNGIDFTQVSVEGAREDARRRYREEHAIPADAFVLGGVMRFSEEKRPLLWLETAELVAGACPDAHFLLVGDGTQRAEVDARVAASPFAGRFHLPGHEQRPYDSMAAMDALLLSSVFEGLPNVLIEAQAMGVPVLSTPAGGAAETFDPGRSGWLAGSGTAREAADAVIHLAGNRDTAARAGAHGRQFVRDRFDLQRMVVETAAAYGGLVARPIEEPARD